MSSNISRILLCLSGYLARPETRMQRFLLPYRLLKSGGNRMGMLKMRSVLHCAILLPSRCKQQGAWVFYVEPAVHRFPIKFSQRRVVHWLRHQYIGNLREGTCLLPNCRASTTISTNLKRQTLSQGWATLPCLNSRETRAFLFLGGQILFDWSKLASFGYFNFYSF